MSDLLTVTEVATRLSVSGPTVRRMIDDGELQSIRIRSAIRIKRTSLDSFLQVAGIPRSSSVTEAA